MSKLEWISNGYRLIKSNKYRLLSINVE